MGKLVIRFLSRPDVCSRLREVFGSETQAAVAERLGVRQGYISRYLRGQVPDPEVLVRISEVYQVSLDWLLRGVGHKDSPQPSYARELGERIRAVREMLSLHRAVFAPALGLESVTELEAVETGDREAPRSWLDRIAARWNVNVHWLQTGDGGMFRRFGGGSSSACREELLRLLQAHEVDRVDVIEGEDAGIPMVAFVVECESASGDEGRVYYIVAGKCSPIGGTGIAVLKEILYDIRYARGLICCGYTLPPKDFVELFSGAVNPAKVIPPWRAQDFDPVEKYLPEAEVRKLRAQRERAEQFEALMKAERQRSLREEVLSWLRSLPGPEREALVGQLRDHEADASSPDKRAQQKASG